MMQLSKMSRTVLLAALGLAFLAVTTDAACPKIPLVKNFNVDKFMGVWYEIQAQPSIFQSIKKCFRSEYKRNGDTIVVSSKGLNNGNRPASSISRMTLTSTPAKMLTDFVSGFTVPYEVVDTDYTSYACVHSCLSFGPITNDFFFIYSRERTLSRKKVEHCKSLVRNYPQVRLSQLRSTPQNGCWKKLADINTTYFYHFYYLDEEKIIQILFYIHFRLQ